MLNNIFKGFDIKWGRVITADDVADEYFDKLSLANDFIKEQGPEDGVAFEVDAPDICNGNITTSTLTGQIHLWRLGVDFGDTDLPRALLAVVVFGLLVFTCYGALAGTVSILAPAMATLTLIAVVERAHVPLGLAAAVAVIWGAKDIAPPIIALIA